ncbi:hypothetical protein MM300_01660 [Evansella sp. LMS18]|jgi:hypothetical protein|uniref:hypothetical protein n=1 Tax=Evansella sp. LMS18 TaxID=2924033 RepID=UPI0020D16186|nr:hypothetical protein [Evansella sp. LMS18]UTR11065.1 hypothetical protein MM300_01660 [Evansella sp. LMS18]
MYIKTAELSDINLLKKNLDLTVSIKYESRDNPENIDGIVVLKKRFQEEGEWTVSDILAWNDKNHRFEIITGLYAPSLIEELKQMALEKLTV